MYHLYHADFGLISLSADIQALFEVKMKHGDNPTFKYDMTLL